MKSKNLKLCISLVVVFLLTGCNRTNNNRIDIIKYVKEEIGITNFNVSKTYKEVEGNDGRKDKLWTVIDKENDVEFSVLDDYVMQTFVHNSLHNDHNARYFNKLYEEGQITNKHNIIYNYEQHYYRDALKSVSLTCKYHNKRELEECYNSALSYDEYIAKYKFIEGTTFKYKYVFDLRNDDDFRIHNADTVTGLGYIDNKVFDKVVYSYYKLALFYQIEDALREISYEDKMMAMNHNNTTRLVKEYNGEILYYYDDVISINNDISFGGLYKILTKEHFNVIGDVNHYTVYYNGNTYEFSYDFNDVLYEKEGKQYNGYYYIKNNQKMKMPSYFQNCFSIYDVNQMFDLNVDAKQNGQYEY